MQYIYFNNKQMINNIQTLLRRSPLSFKNIGHRCFTNTFSNIKNGADNFRNEKKHLLQFSEYRQAIQYQKSLHFNKSVSEYKKILQILSLHSKHKQQYGDLFKIVEIKMIGCLFVEGRYEQIAGELDKNKEVEKNKDHAFNQQLDILRKFIYYSSAAITGVQLNLDCNSKIDKQLKQIAQILFGNKQIQEYPKSNENRQFIILYKISCMLNNSMDYRILLQNLVQNTNKQPQINKISLQQLNNDLQFFAPTLLSQQPAQSQLHSSYQPSKSPCLQLLYHMGITLNRLLDNVQAKKLSNEHINSILKFCQRQHKRLQQKYANNEQNNNYSQLQSTVHQPLINMVMNLIGQKHYMSAEGILGHIKSGESGLFTSKTKYIDDSVKQSSKVTSLQDHKLVQNIYRMLVTRANNQLYSTGWHKQQQVKLGLLVAQRIVIYSLKQLNNSEQDVFRKLNSLFN